MKPANASRLPRPMQQAMVESEGRWPRICALAHLGQQSEVRHVF